MANRMNFCVKSLVFSYIIFCAQRHGIASEDVEYSIDNPSRLDDVSVIDIGRRFRREVTDPTMADHTEEATTPNPNIEDDTAFGQKMYPEEYNVQHIDFKYYHLVTFTAQDINQFYVELDRAENHDALSNSYRTAATATLPFHFQFYGHAVKQVTIATGGFLYMSPFIHKFLTATQYIAPLMANFDTKSGGEQSTILYKKFETSPKKFVVEWKNVYLQDQKESGSFQFQTHLYENGSIFFVYKKLPVAIYNISSKAHPVKIGLSDAFYYDTEAQGVKRRTIYEYHRVQVNQTNIQEGTIVVMLPNPTCNQAQDCETCLTQKIGFPCKWCGIANRCSDGVDWYRQDWMDQQCLRYAGSNNCSLITNTTPQAQRQTNRFSSSTEKSSTRKSSAGMTSAGMTSAEGSNSTIAVVVVVVVIIVALLGALGGWFYYAYTHPTSASGMWLIEHRPTQMKAKLNAMKFWKKSENAGDKYAVESNA